MKKVYDSIIIEHPTRGVLRDWETDGSFHFSYSGLRSDPEKSYQFDSVRSAAIIWADLPQRVRMGCSVLARKTGQAEYVKII
jgi:hypothetical protein